MTGPEKEEEQRVTGKESASNVSLENKTQLFFLGLLSVSFICYFALREHWIGFIFAHLAALSIMGFFGCLAAALAKKKGYDDRRAFQTGFILPIILGGISAFLLPSTGERGWPLTCGGWVSLATGIVTVVSYSLLKQRSPARQF